VKYSYETYRLKLKSSTNLTNRFTCFGAKTFGTGFLAENLAVCWNHMHQVCTQPLLHEVFARMFASSWQRLPWQQRLKNKFLVKTTWLRNAALFIVIRHPILMVHFKIQPFLSLSAVVSI